MTIIQDDSPLPRLSLGTNVYESLALPLIWSLSIVIRNLVVDRINPRKAFTSTKLFCLDYITFVLPQLLALTLFADHLIELVGSLLLLSVLIKVIFPLNREIVLNVPQSDLYTYYRAFVQVSTAIAILGVDFRLFPRRFAKTISYGTSPMDFGTSMFVFAMGFGTGMFKKEKYNYSGKSLKNFFSGLVILIILGFGKPLLTTAFNYRHELTEYGTHWNFFITLAVLKMVTFLPSMVSIIFGIFGSLWLFSQPDLENYLLSDTRNYASLLDSNREGLFSLVGYILLLDISRRFGEDMKQLFTTLPSWKSTAFSLATSSVWFILYHAATEYLDLQPSRRIANIPYILVCLGATHFAIGIFQISMLISGIPKSTKLPTICDYIGSWSLTSFITANLLTGLINTVIQTDSIYSKSLQFSILFGYTVAYSVIVNILCSTNYISKLKIKSA